MVPSIIGSVAEVGKNYSNDTLGCISNHIDIEFMFSLIIQTSCILLASVPCNTWTSESLPSLSIKSENEMLILI